MPWYTEFNGNFFITISGVILPCLMAVIKHRVACCTDQGWLVIEPYDTQKHTNKRKEHEPNEEENPLLETPRRVARNSSSGSEIEIPPIDPILQTPVMQRR